MIFQMDSPHDPDEIPLVDTGPESILRELFFFSSVDEEDNDGSRSIWNDFRRDLITRIESFRSCTDTKTLCRELHSVRGLSAQFGFFALEAVLFFWEKTESDQIASLPRLLPCVLAIAERSIEAIERALPHLKETPASKPVSDPAASTILLQLQTAVRQAEQLLHREHPSDPKVHTASLTEQIVKRIRSPLNQPETAVKLKEKGSAFEDQLSRRIELLPEVVFETDGTGSLVFLNSAWTKCLGHSLEKSLGHPISRFVLGEDRHLCEAAMLGTSSKQSLRRPGIRFCRATGEVVWMRISASKLSDGGVVGVLHDVTIEKSSQDEMTKLSLVASYTDNLVIITDAQGRTEWVNQAFINRTGFTLEDMAGLKPGEILQGPETDKGTVEQISKWISEGKSFKAELLNYTRSREPYWVSIYVTPIHNADGRIEHFISIQSDCTELRQTQRELEEVKERAESGIKSKSKFLATISHEMRTPLNVILGSTDIVLDSDLHPEELPEHLMRISTNAESLLRLITDMLDLSKIEEGQLDFERTPFSLREMLSGILGRLAEKAEAKDLQFQVLFDELLPTQILGDQERVRQIITNLVANAIKFTESGSVRVEISRLRMGQGDRPELEIRILDTGTGIPPDEQERIFECFEQVDGSNTRRKGGAGLGLNIVRALVEAMGGRLTLQSEPGRGSDFRVILPLETPVDENAPPLSYAVRKTAPVERPSAPPTLERILVVEDTDANFRVLSIFLSKAGYNVERAKNGREAIEASGTTDLILMDIEMPEIDGLEATRRIRDAEQKKSRPPVPILALTAHALHGYRERCLQAGCSGYLTKPIRRQTLLTAVRKALDEHKEKVLASRIVPLHGTSKSSQHG